MPFTSSRIEKQKFYMGQAELAAMAQRIIRYYKFHNDNKDPKEIIIPLLGQVDGVKISYEQGIPHVEVDTVEEENGEPDMEPAVGEFGDLHSRESGDKQGADTTDPATG